MSTVLDTRVTLNNGIDMPALGLGVFQAPRGEVTKRAVAGALEAGYRHIDTAAVYGNEGDVGRAVRASGIPRSEIFVTTKLWNSHHGYDAALSGFERSIDRLGLEYVDLFLIHWPVPELRLATWEGLEDLARSDRCRAIGVSNYMRHHLEELLVTAEIVPAVNQIELSPYNYRSRRGVVELCEERSIRLEAYSPLTRGIKLNDPPLCAIAGAHGKTPAQVLIRWGLQKGFVVIPKSVTRARIVENAQVFDFELTKEQIEALDALDEGLTTGWDPADAP